MDFVVAGFGIGAILALAGFALWEFFGESEETARSWIERAAIGLMLGAPVIWAVTAVSLFSTVDDALGWVLVLATTLIALLAISIVTFMYWRVEQSIPTNTARRQVHDRTPAADVAPAESTVRQPVTEIEWGEWPERKPSVKLPDQIVADAIPDIQPSRSAEPDGIGEVMERFEPEGPVEFELAVPAGSDIEMAEPVAEEPVALESTDGVSPERSISELSETSLADEDIPETIQRPVGEHIPDNEPLRTELAAAKPFELIVPPQREPSIDEPAAETDLSKNEGIDLPELVPSEHSIEKNEVQFEPVVSGMDDDPVAENEDTGSVVVDDNDTLESGEKPAAFASALLADIDLTVAEHDGHYRSPLLADLEKNAGTLEDLGLAKWRSEDRLTSDEQKPTPKQR